MEFIELVYLKKEVLCSSVFNANMIQRFKEEDSLLYTINTSLGKTHVSFTFKRFSVSRDFSTFLYKSYIILR